MAMTPACADIVKTVKRNFSGSDDFFPVTEERNGLGKLIIGWTFQVHGVGWVKKYGWATTEGFVFTGLCNSRDRAEEILRKVILDEEIRMGNLHERRNPLGE